MPPTAAHARKPVSAPPAASAEPSGSAAVRDAIRDAVDGRDLDAARARAVAGAIMEGRATQAQIAGLLVALRMKGETVDEIAGFARAMRERATVVDRGGLDVVDTCGTGGDALGTFNVSTVCAFVVAGAGVPVAKHGNRSVSSRCGSAEVLEALGVGIDAGPREAARRLQETGLAFLFAPNYHRATRHAVGPRREVGTRSIFNLVGPLTNPAGARRQLMGVFRGDLTEDLAQVLRRLGSERALVVHGEDGLDEISIAAATRVSELRDGAVRTYTLTPESLGLSRATLDDVRGGGPATNARIALEILAGEPGPARDLVLLNAGAAIYVGGGAPTIAAGLARAERSIDGGAARAALEAQRRG